MKSGVSVLSFARCLPLLLLLLSMDFILTFPIGSSGQGEEKKTVVTKGASDVSIRTYTEIPEGTELCTLEEADWWKRLGTAGNELQKKNDSEKLKKQFLLLLYEGQQKSYRIPIKDQSVRVLLSVTESNGNEDPKVNGTVELSVEYRADAAVGDIEVIKGIRKDIDERVVRRIRQTSFLPAVKNGVFVDYRGSSKISFSSANPHN